MVPASLPVILIFLFLYGAVIGSFLNVCIYRIPRKEGFRDSLKGILRPPSSCPGCGNRIPIWDNIPVLGWLKLKGRCRFCRMRISPRYPLIEFFNGLLFVTVYWLEVPTSLMIADSVVHSPLGPVGVPGSGWLSPQAVVHWRYAYHIVLFEALVVATFIDFDLKIIPDPITLPTMAIGLVGAWIIGQVHLVPLWFQSPSVARSLQLVLPEWTSGLLSGPAVPGWFSQYPHWHGLLVSLAGLVVGGGLVWSVRIVGHWVLRQEAMGFGDVILMAMIGSFLGWQPTIVVFFIAPACALIFGVISWLLWRNREIPYGPYLSIGTLIVVLGWKWIWPYADRIFSLGPLLFVMALVMLIMLVLSLQLMQGIKWLLGFPLYTDEWHEGWTSADQLSHFAGETVDIRQGRWRVGECCEWPGVPAARGTAFDERWRRGHSCHGQQRWPQVKPPS